VIQPTVQAGIHFKGFRFQPPGGDRENWIGVKHVLQGPKTYMYGLRVYVYEVDSMKHALLLRKHLRLTQPDDISSQGELKNEDFHSFSSFMIL